MDRRWLVLAPTVQHEMWLAYSQRQPKRPWGVEQGVCELPGIIEPAEGDVRDSLPW